MEEHTYWTAAAGFEMKDGRKHSAPLAKTCCPEAGEGCCNAAAVAAAAVFAAVVSVVVAVEVGCCNVAASVVGEDYCNVAVAAAACAAAVAVMDCCNAAVAVCDGCCPCRKEAWMELSAVDEWKQWEGET